MINIGVVLPNLENNQLSFLVAGQINAALQENTNYNFTIFCEDFSKKHIKARCPILNAYLINAFKGLVITTSLSNTIKSLNAVHTNPVVFYVWKLEWIHNKNIKFDWASSIYNTPKLNLITRSKEYALALENYSNKNVEVLPNIPLIKIHEQYRNLV